MAPFREELAKKYSELSRPSASPCPCEVLPFFQQSLSELGAETHKDQDPLGNVTTFEYDTQGNLVAITDPEQNLRPAAERLKTRITYNSFGQPITTTDPLGNTTTFEYDSVGNLTAIVDPLGNRTTRTYDTVSRLVTQTDPRGKVTRFAYDPLNRLTQIRDPLAGTPAFSYDPNGNLTAVTDARGSTTTHTYDTMDRLLTRTDPLGRGESYQYDPMGNLTQFTDRKNQGSTFVYDALNRRTRATFGDGAFTEFVYDAVGRLTSATDSLTGTITEEYDVLNRLFRETTPQGSIQYAYDANGRRTQMTVNGQAPVSYAYDAVSRLTQLAQAPLAPVDIQYDATGRRTLLRLPNGVTTAYDYDAASRLTRLAYTSPSALLGDLTYTYDPAGNRTAVGGSFARTLLPDPVTSASYDAANQQLAFGNKSMAYDLNGNLVSLTEPTGSTTFTWDARNRLVALGGPTTGSFAYDVQGRRIHRDLGGELREYQYDGVDAVRERINGADTSYLRTLGIDEAVCRIAPEGTEYYLADALSSTLALADGAGTISTSYTYEPFGRTVASGLSSRNPFQFTRRENDGGEMYYYRARYYSPGRSRFLSEDPRYSPLLQTKKCQSAYNPSVSRYVDIDGNLGSLMAFGFYQEAVPALGPNPQQLHLYTYANDNPVNRVDPMGLWAVFKQKEGCDVVGGRGGFFDSPCAKECCNEHDRCYEEAIGFCTALSWIDSPNIWDISCKVCNAVVVKCLFNAYVNSGGSGRKNC